MGAAQRSDGQRRPRAIEAGDDTAGVRLEYIRSRRVLRLGGWHSGGRKIEPVELPASMLLPELGIAPDELRVSPVYLLLAGVREPQGRRVRRVTTAFANELEARQAFRRLRAADPVPAEWAELLALDIACRLSPLCWFGDPGDQPGARLAVGDTAPSGGAESWRLRWRRRNSRAGEQYGA